MAITKLLIDAIASLDRGKVEELFKQNGEANLCQLLIDEVRFRMDMNYVHGPINIAFDVAFPKGKTFSTVFVFDQRDVKLAEDLQYFIHRRITITAFDLSCILYSSFTRQNNYGFFRDEFYPSKPDDYSGLASHFAATGVATANLMSGLGGTERNLSEICRRYGSDKWASFHWYTPHYETHFSRFRRQAVTLLEIGIGGYNTTLGGASLKMWKEYFALGDIHGADIFDKSGLDTDRISTHIVDQSKPETFKDILKHEYDIIIDDGSHDSLDIINTFNTLFPALKSGGLYVIEDLQTAYNERFHGTQGSNAGEGTSIGLLKSLLDGIHQQEWTATASAPGFAPTVTKHSITAVHAYHNIAFLEKGDNRETGLPRWMDDDAWSALGAVTPETHIEEKE